MRFISIILFAMLVSCVSTRESSEKPFRDLEGRELVPLRNPSNSNYSYGENDSMVTGDDLSLKELKDILVKRRFSKIEDLLAHLHQTKPAYMSRYALMHDSRSLHESSKEHPRVIIYGRTGNFMITFNGHPRQSGYQMLEVVEFNQKDKRFEYREIEFKELEGKGPPYKISGIGGPEGKCLQCHTNSRPIWEAYPKWPGAIGEDDDVPLGRVAARAGDFLNESIVRRPVYKSLKAEKAWLDFKETHSKVGRYRFLHPINPSSDIFGDENGSRPNSDMSFLITRLNMQRIGRILKKHVERSFRYAYVYGAFCYDEVKRINRFKEREQLIPIPENLDRLVVEYAEKYDRSVLSHETYKVVSLVRNLLSEEEVRQHWIKTYERRKEPVPFTDQDSFNQAAEKVLARERGAAGQTRAGSLYATIAAITERYFPKARVETWSSGLYEGVLRFDTGSGRESTWFQNEVLQAFFTDTEVKSIKSGLGENFLGYCQQLIPLMPQELK